MLRRIIPDTLVGRTLLVLLVGLLLSQLAAVVLFSFNKVELASRLGSRQTAERLAGVVQLVEDTPEEDRSRLIRSLDRPALRVGWGQSPVVQGAANSDELADELRPRLPGHLVFAAMRMPAHMILALRDGGPAPGAGLHHNRPPVTLVAVRLEDGSWLNFILPEPPREPLWRLRLFGPLLGGLVVVIGLSALAVRRASRPLAEMAAAAERLGRDVKAPPLPINGPREVRAAALAFNRMQRRLKRFVDDRVQMVAAISHDLRTPITRLKLRAEFIEDDEQRMKMLADLDEMESMIAATLSFARDDAAREPHQPVDVACVVRDLCAEFHVSYSGPDSLVISAGVTGLKRAFANLLDNAVKYGRQARLSVGHADTHVTLTLEDDGPGLPEGELVRVFAPFYRVETSRNRDTGGTGLGLAVARSAVRAHGGDIVLSNRPDGGLRVTVTLPA
jgi:signal transduction histidine kinase